MKDIKDTVLVVDDEPIFLDWLEDFLESLGYKTKFLTNVSDALAEVKNARYRALIVDLNIPLSTELKSLLTDKDSAYGDYHGLLVADRARNVGYRDKQVIVYSVHSTPSVKAITDKLRILYFSKGRPKAFKAEIQDVLEYDPTQN